MTTQTFDPHTATLEQCCDYIAECKGWMRPTGADPYWSKCGPTPKVSHPLDCPVPPTLDSIARSSPEDVSVIFVAGPKPEWVCTLGIGSGCVKTWVTAGADTELLARARCSALAWKTVKEAKQ